MREPIFTPATWDFLSDLRANNDRLWFEANKKRYEAHVKAPLLHFITAFAEPLRRLHPDFVADPRPAGGSMFRIHRDVRFSRDKSPYKVHAAAHFRHRAGKDAHAPGFYVHLEPGDSMLGIGLWQPEPPVLQQLRTSLVDHPDRWIAARDATGFRPPWSITGERAARVPKGYPADHPLADDLRLKDFVAMCPLSEEEIFGPDFVDIVYDRFSRAVPMQRALLTAIGLGGGA